MKHLALALLLIPTFLISAPTAHACSCMMTTVEEAFERADAVFVGQATDSRKVSTNEWDGTNYFTFLASNTYKGRELNVVEVSSPVSSATCGIGFEKGKIVSVFVQMQEDGTYTTNLCSGSAMFTEQEVKQAAENFENNPPMDCTPYICADNSEQPRCTEDGHVINYFVEPCFGHDADDNPPIDIVPYQPLPREPLPTFTDIFPNHPNFEAIVFVKQQGIVDGYNDGTYKPNATINRAEFTKILIGAVNIDTQALCRMSSFPDAPMGEWYGPYIHAARCHGIISGYPDGTFKPANSINFAEAAKIVVETFGLQDSNESKDSEEAKEWYEPYFETLKVYNAVPPGNHYPSEKVTRGDMAEIIFRLMINVDIQHSSAIDTIEQDVLENDNPEKMLPPDTQSTKGGLLLLV